MEEQRIGVMYVNMVKRWAVNTWDALFPNGLMRSKLFPALIVAAVVIIPSVAYYLHIYGRFHLVKDQINGNQAVPGPVGPQPGGLDPIKLTRSETVGGNMPEFRSATLLPGLGMGVLQITAMLPNRGEVPLLVGPSLKDLADNTMTGRSGANDNHGSLELPWSGALPGLVSPIGTAMSAVWHGNTLSVTRGAYERAGMSEGGMLSTQGVDSSNVMQQGAEQVATAQFNNDDFGGHWPSKTNITVAAQLGAMALQLTVTARNVGNEPEPMGIGWHPRFAIPSGDRDGVQLRLPNGERLEIADRSRGIPTGKVVGLGDALSRFLGHAAAIGTSSLDETEVNLKPGVLDSASSVEFRDPASGYGLRLTALSTSIRALRVSAPSGSHYVSLGMQTNLDDPFGKDWVAPDLNPIVTLQPGQSIEWKVRLEIFPVAQH